MKYSEIVKKLQEENKAKIVLVKNGICKCGIPVNAIEIAIPKMIRSGYNYIIFDYDKKEKGRSCASEADMSQQMNMFDGTAGEPLAARLRPRDLDEFVGQKHLLGEGKILRRLIEGDNIGSMIFWGPPGVGKTTLARIIAHRTKSRFVDFSAVTSGIKEIKQVMEDAEKGRRFGEKTILFVDEIHRFNKAQQDAFLPFVEKGSIILIGATTENPSFEVNGALLSRCKVFVLQALSEEDIIALLSRAITDERGFGTLRVDISEDALKAIASFANGDARSALSTLEMAVLNGEEDEKGIHVGHDTIEQCTSRKSLLYDKTGEEHYNIISALHKSMRNSDPDAAVYWLARMLEAGEDPLYVARRVIRFASEDVGLADPRALTVAVSAQYALEKLGLPEGRIPLTEAIIYVAQAPKSNSVVNALYSADDASKNAEDDTIPYYLRDANYKTEKVTGYKYPHDYGGWVEQQYLPDALKNARFYFPGDNGEEKGAVILKETRGKDPRKQNK